VFGVAALAFGLITLAGHDYSDWHRLRYIVYAAATAQIFGGAMRLFWRFDGLESRRRDPFGHGRDSRSRPSAGTARQLWRAASGSITSNDQARLSLGH